MPRINLEDKFFVDVGAVAAKLGDYDVAIGQAVRWIKFGQDRFREGKKITRQEFQAEFSDALIPKFARPNGDFMEVAGADEHFGWLQQKKNAGRKGGSTPPKQTPPEPSGGKQKQAEQSESDQPETQESGDQRSEASSSYSPSSSDLNTLAADSPPAAPPPAQNASPGETRGTVIPVLSGNSRLQHTLQFVPADVQRSWIERWTPRSVVATIQNGIDHHLTEAGAQSLAGVTDWGARITRWMRQEKVTLVERKDPLPARPKDTRQWGTGAKEVLGGVTPMEAFRRQKNGQVGTA